MIRWVAVVSGVACIGDARAQDWTAPVEVLHELKRCVSYRATVNGEHLVIRVALEPGWHTFAMDNVKRAEEKLAGRQSLGIDQPTEITLTGALAASPPWLQSPPKDFSKPELRWFSWGFENQAMFVAKVRRLGPGLAEIGIRGQACTETTCKNIDVSISLPAGGKAGGSPVDLKTLVPVK